MLVEYVRQTASAGALAAAVFTGACVSAQSVLLPAVALQLLAHPAWNGPQVCMHRYDSAQQACASVWLCNPQAVHNLHGPLYACCNRPVNMQHPMQHECDAQAPGWPCTQLCMHACAPHALSPPRHWCAASPPSSTGDPPWPTRASLARRLELRYHAAKLVAPTACAPARCCCYRRRGGAQTKDLCPSVSHALRMQRVGAVAPSLEQQCRVARAENHAVRAFWVVAFAREAFS